MSILSLNASGNSLGTVCLMPGGSNGCNYLGLQYFSGCNSNYIGRPFVESREYGTNGCFAQAIIRDDSFVISHSAGQVNVQFIWTVSFYGFFNEDMYMSRYVQCGIYELC